MKRLKDNYKLYIQELKYKENHIQPNSLGNTTVYLLKVEN